MKAVEDFPARLTERIRAAGLRLTLSPEQIESLEDYYGVLSKWNPRVNLTSLPLDGFPPRTLDRLFIEPFTAAEFIENTQVVWLDLGSGGGSPALPLKILRPLARLTLVESKGKKGAFLREAVRHLELSSVTVLEARIEALSQHIAPGSVELVTVRAVKLTPTVLETINVLLRPLGRLFLFGAGSADAASGVTVPGFRDLLGQDLPSGSGRLTILAKL